MSKDRFPRRLGLGGLGLLCGWQKYATTISLSTMSYSIKFSSPYCAAFVKASEGLLNPLSVRLSRWRLNQH